MTANLEGQRVPALEDGGVMALADELNHVVGTGPALLARPAGKRTLVLMADKGGWRIALGDRTASMPADEQPSASVADGSGAAYLTGGARVRLAGPTRLTVKAYAADSVLTYWWL